MADRPQVPNMPGVKWRLYVASGQWEARWKPRADLVARGYPKASPRLWIGREATEKEIADIQAEAERLQRNMLVWGHGGLPENVLFDGSVSSLVRCYQTDAESPYRTVEHASRVQYDKLCRRLLTDVGDWEIAQTNTRAIKQQHRVWTEASGVPMAHALVTMLRGLTGFGATVLEDTECQRVRGLLGLMRFKAGERRQVFISYEQASALCGLARERGYPAIALAQALQFELGARQKDVIGAWVPQSDPTPTEVTAYGRKWIKGVRWSSIDGNWILRHKTSKRKKMLVADLRLAPLVVRELELSYPNGLPSSGPVIVDHETTWPYDENRYRILWRRLADELGFPKGLQNRDSRSGAATEGFAAGAAADDVRKAMTHSQLSTTMIYSRGEEEAVARVQVARVKARTKS